MPTTTWGSACARARWSRRSRRRRRRRHERHCASAAVLGFGDLGRRAFRCLASARPNAVQSSAGRARARTLGAAMNLSRFFIDRPIFASVLSVLILLGGLIALRFLPISEYPEVVPPSVVVTANYPGANPKVIAETVATPLEEQINGVEGMLYMSSQATSDGQMTLTVTFKLGTDPDLAQQKVQNRVAQAEPRLPEEVRRLGVTTVKSAVDFTMVVHLVSPSERYDVNYLRNYALLNVKDRLARVEGVGQVLMWGGGDYAMRVWLDPRK